MILQQVSAQNGLLATGMKINTIPFCWNLKLTAGNKPVYYLYGLNYINIY